MMKVMKNTNAKAVKNSHAKIKLVFIILRKATSSERFSFGALGEDCILTSCGVLK